MLSSGPRPGVPSIFLLPFCRFKRSSGDLCNLFIAWSKSSILCSIFLVRFTLDGVSDAKLSSSDPSSITRSAGSCFSVYARFNFSLIYLSALKLRRYRFEPSCSLSWNLGWIFEWCSLSWDELPLFLLFFEFIEVDLGALFALVLFFLASTLTPSPVSLPDAIPRLLTSLL